MKKIKIKSMVPYKVGLNISEHRINRVFTQEGQIVLIDDEILQEAMYNRGVSNLFKKGILSVVDDNDFKVEVGLADVAENNKVEDTVFTLNRAQMLAYLKVKPFSEFKEAIDKMSREQVELMVSLAIEEKCTDYEKCKLLKKITGRDVSKIISLNED